MPFGNGTTQIDFGPPTLPATSTSRVITGLTGLTLTGQAEAWLRAEATNDHSVDEARVHGPRVLAEVTGAGEITISAEAAGDHGDYGTYIVDYAWRDTGVLTWPAVTAYYSSPGGAGDYAEADSVVAARVVFPGASAPVCTVLAWAKNLPTSSLNGLLYLSDDGAPMLLVNFTDDPNLSITIKNAAGVADGLDAPIVATGGWQMAAVNFDGSDAVAFMDAVEMGTFTLPAAPYSAIDVFKMAFNGTGSFAIDWRNILIIDRALSANEIADLYAAGPTHHPLNAAGSHWAAGQSIPVIWCTPAVNGSVANSGDGGPCRLSLRGSVTSEEDA